MARTAKKSDDRYYVCDYDGIFLNLALKKMGEDTSFEHRKRIAQANGLENYIGLGKDDKFLLDLLKEGKLVKAD